MNIKVIKKGSSRPVQAPVGQAQLPPKPVVPTHGPCQRIVTCKADALRLLGGTK